MEEEEEEGVPSMFLLLFFHILNIHLVKRCDIQMVGRAGGGWISERSQ